MIVIFGSLLRARGDGGLVDSMALECIAQRIPVDGRQHAQIVPGDRPVGREPLFDERLGLGAAFDVALVTAHLGELLGWAGALDHLARALRARQTEALDVVMARSLAR